MRKASVADWLPDWFPIRQQTPFRDAARNSKAIDSVIPTLVV
jgi:hypothetical protein